MTILKADALTYTFPGGVPALSGLNLSIKRGRKLAILGPNGSGKTTLLMHLNGTLRPSSGQVFLDGQPVGYSRRALTAWRRRVGLALQDADDQLFAASVFEDVSFGPLNMGLGDIETKERVIEALRIMNIADLADRPTHMLSGGQKKRVAIAGIVAMRPEVLLLDEPTSGLDHHASAHLLAVLRKISEAGTTLVFTTHDVDLAYSIADEVALFNEGKVVAKGPSEKILADDEALSRAHLNPPMLLQLALKARCLGWLGVGESLPQTLQEILDLMERKSRDALKH
ncbi:MAG: ATP-binding cassette domain-containing protein [Magnetococcales bacterium]|nr:ATP-binding cassette domain-containing protein [Magnetococcales bacterium]MBF0150999.1 ATP-binding cassette domain-containing protein [Magnetococcales bacterium]MBF0172697.1 ATP-binding cassette domain-containing protein [Magnetococcales bacterium]MBF0347890.1 ATP-binding cassette domain-containing protein [Magnetococcales bacterium]MBF0629411.1 ATP-binding cassette domain-containing protein [Magnetococcales bacterium]